MKSFDGQEMQGSELALLCIVIAAIAAFIFYVSVYAPKRMREKARHIAQSEVRQEDTEKRRRDSLTPTQRRLEDEAANKARAERQEQERAEAAKKTESEMYRRFGSKVAALVCPHCQSRGSVRRSDATRVTKNRVNSVAGRAIGLGTNSEKSVKRLHCDSCDMTWDID